jgi:hypothetical protein
MSFNARHHFARGRRIAFGYPRKNMVKIIVRVRIERDLHDFGD